MAAIRQPSFDQPTFLISRDPPEGGTGGGYVFLLNSLEFLISRDPPEGGTFR